jgi:hypothetical protein
MAFTKNLADLVLVNSSFDKALRTFRGLMVSTSKRSLRGEI